jgi:hypothetical protein
LSPHSPRVDPGIRTADTVIVGLVNEERREATLDAVRSEPSVASVAASWPGGLSGRAALAEGATGKSTVTYQFVSPEYFSVLGIDLLRGRGFAPTERSGSASVAVVSESVARQLWPGLDAIGQVLRLEPDPPALSGAEGKSDTRELDAPPLLSRTVIPSARAMHSSNG